MDSEKAVTQPEPTACPVATKKATPVEDVYSLLRSDVDLGGFISPLEHVSLSEILKKPSHQLSIYDGQVPNEQRASSYTVGAKAAAFHTEPEAADLKEISDGIHDHTLSRGLTSSRTVERETLFDGPSEDINYLFDDALDAAIHDDNCTTTGADAPMTVGAKQVVHADDETTAPPDLTLVAPATGLRAEGDEAGKSLSQEEQQKKMWEGIDQWMYDEFHEYVELI